MTDMVKIGSVLNELMSAKGFTLASLAKASGVPRSTLQEWSSNRPPKNPSQVKKVASALGVTIHYLLFGVEDQQEPLQRILADEIFSGTFEINIKRIKVVQQ